MNLKRKWIVILIVIVMAIISSVLFVPQRTNMALVDVGHVTFVYRDKNVHTVLSEEDLSEILKILDNKVLYIDYPACGFSESVSIQLNESEIFCIACDGHNLIYWKNKDRYFTVSKKEIVYLHELLSKYGISFPGI